MKKFLIKKDEGNHWENLKKEYMEKNPGDYMGEDPTRKLSIGFHTVGPFWVKPGH